MEKLGSENFGTFDDQRVCANSQKTLSVLPHLPAEVWSSITDYLPAKDVKNFGFTCKVFRNIVRLPLNKKCWIALQLSCAKSFTDRMNKFCRDIHPLLLPNISKLKMSLNTSRYSSRVFPDMQVVEDFQTIANRLVFVRQRNDSYTVRQVFEMFVEIELKVGIGAHWHILCFTEMWNLIRNANLKRLNIVFFFANNVTLTEDVVHNLGTFETVKLLKIGFYSQGTINDNGFMQPNTTELLLSKFPNADRIEIFPKEICQNIFTFGNENEADKWKMKTSLGCCTWCRVPQ